MSVCVLVYVCVCVFSSFQTWQVLVFLGTARAGVFWGTTLVPLSNPTLHTSHFPINATEREGSECPPRWCPSILHLLALPFLSILEMLHAPLPSPPRGSSHSFPGARQWPGLEEAQALRLAQVWGAVSERVPVTWGCDQLVLSLGKACSLAFNPQTEVRFVWFGGGDLNVLRRINCFCTFPELLKNDILSQINTALLSVPRSPHCSSGCNHSPL